MHFLESYKLTLYVYILSFFCLTINKSTKVGQAQYCCKCYHSVKTSLKLPWKCESYLGVWTNGLNGASMHLCKPASLGSWTNLVSQLPSTTSAICQTRYPVSPFVIEGRKQDHSFYGQILLDATQSDCSVSISLNESLG